MKKKVIYSVLFGLILFYPSTVKSQSIEKNKEQFKSTNTVTSYQVGSEKRMTYMMTQSTDDGICNFTGYCSMKANPMAEINMGFHFGKLGIQLNDTLNTQSFSKIMDLNSVKRIQMDSLTYEVIDDEVKLKFIVSLIREEKERLKIVDKYSMVYSSGFNHSKPSLVVDRIEKKSIEIFGAIN